MRKMKTLPLLLLAGLPAFSLADDVQQDALKALRDAQQEKDNQINQLQQQERQDWIDKHSFQDKQEPTPPETNPSITRNDIRNQCLPYAGKISYSGFTLIDPEKYTPHADECVNEARLNQLSRDLTKAYLDKGYLHNQLDFKIQDGQIAVDVNEGKITVISSDSQRVNYKTLFPNMLGKPLNIKDLDQGLDQANKMAGSSVTVDVLPQANGDIELALTNKESNRVSGSVSLDNTASKRNGYAQIRANLNVDSPLGLSDTLYVSASSNLKNPTKNYSRSATVYHTIPYGRYSFSTFASMSKYRSELQLQKNKAIQDGRTWQAGIKGSAMLHRGENHITGASLQLEHSDTKSNFAGETIELQSPRLTTLQANLNHTQILKNGSLSLDVTYERGLNALNATKNKGRDQPEPQFNRLSADINLSRYQQIKDKLFRHSHSLSLQTSNNYLPASKQADLLGRYNVRGFKSLSRSAEKSAVLRNELAWLMDAQTVKLEPYIAFDIGAQKASTGYTKAERAFGYATGLKARSPQGSWQATVEYSKGTLLASDYQPKQHDKNLYIGVSSYF